MLLQGRQALLDATDNHPYVRLTAGGDAAGEEADGTVVWIAQGPWGPMCGSLGNGETAVALLAKLAQSGRIDGLHCHLPQMPHEQVSRHVKVKGPHDWDFLWTAEAPAASSDGVVELSNADSRAIEAVLDDAMPEGTTRPGDPLIRAWHGIYEGDRLVAVAADRSTQGVGFLTGIAVASRRQGNGLGSILTATLTDRLVAEFGLCSLGVMVDNQAAIRLYQRLGYSGRLPLTSVTLAGA